MLLEIEKQPIINLKLQLKAYAIEIRKLKASRKQDKREGRQLHEIQTCLWKLTYDARHMHIVYCELRGRTREQIEKPGRFNLANETYINTIKEKYYIPVWKPSNVTTICVS